MSELASPDTKAILLLTSTFGGKPSTESVQPLTASEYRKVARRLHELNYSPSTLTSTSTTSGIALEGCSKVIDRERLRRLLARGLLLGQALERWSARGIWVASKLDNTYPERVRKVMRADAPPVLYGAGDPGISTKPALGIVGSRKVASAIISQTETIARFAAQNDITVVSGGAKGVDRAAMLSALGDGGYAVGVLADSLERAVVEPGYRDALRAGNLLLISPFEPSARFQVWAAMHRNKLIYASSDAVLVMESAVSEGGTWSGAVEQLEKCRYAPIFVRPDEPPSIGLRSLQSRGAIPWRYPVNLEQFTEYVAEARLPQDLMHSTEQLSLESTALNSLVHARAEPDEERDIHGALSGVTITTPSTDPSKEVNTDTQETGEIQDQKIDRHGADATPAEALFAHVRQVIRRVLDHPRSATEIAESLEVSKSQAKAWLDRMVNEQELRMLKRGLYVISQPNLPFS